MKQIRWLYKDPAKTTPEQALRIIRRVLKGASGENIAMALKHRKKWPDNPAGYCGLTQWIRRVIIASKEPR